MLEWLGSLVAAALVDRGGLMRGGVVHRREAVLHLVVDRLVVVTHVVHGGVVDGRGVVDWGVVAVATAASVGADEGREGQDCCGGVLKHGIPGLRTFKSGHAEHKSIPEPSV